MNQLLVRGIVLIAIALCFGIPAFTYRVGSLANAGPGLFPLLVSCILGLLGLVMVVRSQVEAAPRLTVQVRNLALVLASLIGFALIAEHFKVIPAIVYLVFVAALAGSDYSVVRNLKICAGLIAIAYGFHALLGLNLPLL